MNKKKTIRKTPPAAMSSKRGAKRDYARLLKTIEAANTQMVGLAAVVVNQALVLRNWLVGAYIVEYEQGGADRATYGEGLLNRLSQDLNQRNVRGCSVKMLERMRLLYLTYPQLADMISSTLLTKSPDGPRGPKLRISSPPVTKSGSNAVPPLAPDQLLRLSWSHLINLIVLDDPLKRAFYENECLKGNWSKRQLQRQIESLLYERTGLSENKQAVVRRAHRQEPQETVADLIRDPYVLEFTGLAEQLKALVEDDRARLAALTLKNKKMETK